MVRLKVALVLMVNVPEEITVSQPALIMVIGPVVAPTGTVAEICPSLSMKNTAGTPLNQT
ncbi:MAG: hypothetical protein IPN36_10950 [Bacteroidetes bacterium]|nr:hypothetical protein [Bacteroidota bacterium]